MQKKLLVLLLALLSVPHQSFASKSKRHSKELKKIKRTASIPEDDFSNDARKIKRAASAPERIEDLATTKGQQKKRKLKRSKSAPENLEADRIETQRRFDERLESLEKKKTLVSKSIAEARKKDGSLIDRLEKAKKTFEATRAEENEAQRLRQELKKIDISKLDENRIMKIKSLKGDLEIVEQSYQQAKLREKMLRKESIQLLKQIRKLSLPATPLPARFLKETELKSEIKRVRKDRRNLRKLLKEEDKDKATTAMLDHKLAPLKQKIAGIKKDLENKKISPESAKVRIATQQKEIDLYKSMDYKSLRRTIKKDIESKKSIEKRYQNELTDVQKIMDEERGIIKKTDKEDAQKATQDLFEEVN